MTDLTRRNVFGATAAGLAGIGLTTRAMAADGR